MNLQAEQREEDPKDEHDHGATVGARVDTGVPGLLDDDDGLLAWGEGERESKARGERSISA